MSDGSQQAYDRIIDRCRRNLWVREARQTERENVAEIVEAALDWRWAEIGRDQSRAIGRLIEACNALEATRERLAELGEG